jgi:anti-sigma B factor antagonist
MGSDSAETQAPVVPPRKFWCRPTTRTRRSTLETIMGVFTSREQAEHALKQLLKDGVQEREIVFLSRSEHEAVALGKEIGATAGSVAGGAVGLGAGMVVASLALIPGLGQVFAVGVGAAALLAFLGKQGGEAVGKRLAAAETEHVPAEDAIAAEDAQTFIEVLKEGRSLIVVRTESEKRAKAAADVLDEELTAAHSVVPASGGHKAQTGLRQVAPDVTAVDLTGRIVIGEGNVMLRDTIQKLIEGGNRRVILVMEHVEHIDSSGIGELVRAHTQLRKASGHLKIAKPSTKVHEMLQITMLHKVLDVHPDEDSAVRSFNAAAKAAG